MACQAAWRGWPLLLVLGLSGLWLSPAASADGSDCVLLDVPGQSAAADVEMLFGVPLRTDAVLAATACLQQPDPVIRDQRTYGAFASVLRDGGVSPATLRALRDRLLFMMRTAETDTQGFRGPFAVLVLAEVARVDRLTPWQSRAERSDLVDAGATYLEQLQDLRGFDAEAGWRHGVAHGADLLMQLSLHPDLRAADARRIVMAVASKVAPPGTHAYVFGEPGRLARPVLFLARKGLLDAPLRVSLLQALAPDIAQPRWVAPYSSAAGLAALHNTRAFLRVLALAGPTSDVAGSIALGDAARVALEQLP